MQTVRLKMTGGLKRHAQNAIDDAQEACDEVYEMWRGGKEWFRWPIIEYNDEHGYRGTMMLDRIEAEEDETFARNLSLDTLTVVAHNWEHITDRLECWSGLVRNIRFISPKYDSFLDFEHIDGLIDHILLPNNRTTSIPAIRQYESIEVICSAYFWNES